MNSKSKNAIKILIWSIIFCLAYFLISLIVSNKSDIIINDAIFYVSMAFLIIGVLFMMKGNPSGLSLRALGSKNAQYVANYDLETTRAERDITDFNKNFFKHAIVETNSLSLVMILGAILAIASSIIFF